MPKPPAGLIRVNNGSDGNCLYYSYGISLMYFLRQKNDSAITQRPFDKLKLSSSNQARLNKLMTDTSGRKFTRSEIRTIERITCKPIKQLMTDRTEQEYLNDPDSSNLVTSTTYGLEYYFKRVCRREHADFARLITNNFTNRDYTEAEIYRVRGIKAELRKYAEKISESVREEFKAGWDEELKKRNAFRVARGGEAIQEKNYAFHKRDFLQNILRRRTIDFFSENKNTRLKTYLDHINSDKRYGTENDLFTLNRAMQGERIERTKHGKLKLVYDDKISLCICTDYRKADHERGKPFDLTFNNEGNGHWTSFIPESAMTAGQKPSSPHSKPDLPPKTIKPTPSKKPAPSKKPVVGLSGNKKDTQKAPSKAKSPKPSAPPVKPSPKAKAQSKTKVISPTSPPPAKRKKKTSPIDALERAKRARQAKRKQLIASIAQELEHFQKEINKADVPKDKYQKAALVLHSIVKAQLDDFE